MDISDRLREKIFSLDCPSKGVIFQSLPDLPLRPVISKFPPVISVLSSELRRRQTFPLTDRERVDSLLSPFTVPSSKARHRDLREADSSLLDISIRTSEKICQPRNVFASLPKPNPDVPFGNFQQIHFRPSQNGGDSSAAEDCGSLRSSISFRPNPKSS